MSPHRKSPPPPISQATFQPEARRRLRPPPIKQAAFTVGMAVAMSASSAFAQATIRELSPEPEAKAEGPEGRVTQVFRDSKRATVQFPKGGQGVALGQSVVISNSAGEACEGSLIALKGGRATAEFPNCSAFSDFKAGATVSPSDHETAAPEADSAPIMADPRERTRERSRERSDDDGPTPARRKPRFRFAAKAFWDSGSALKFESAKIADSSATYNGTVEYKMDSAAGIAGEVFVSEERSWGFSGGLSYEFPRKLRSVDLGLRSTSGSPYAGPAAFSGDTTLEILSLYGNVIYRWTNWYIPFGIQIARPMFRSEPAALNDMTLGFGIQVHGGYWITENLAAEFGLRSLAMAQKSSYAATGSTDLGSGTITSLQLGLKGAF